MKKIVCELCESTEFIKDSGIFVCQGCGTKYTAEEARGMMREVEGGAAPAGVPVMPVGNPNQQQLDNILMLATNAFSAGNNEETEKYCNKAIELDATCYKAWLLKGKAAGWSSTIQNPKITEAAHAFKQAVDFAPDEEKESLMEEAKEELMRLGLACISLHKQRFSKYPNEEELNGLVSDLDPLIEGLVVLLSKQVEDSGEWLLGGILTGANNATMKFIGMKKKAEAAGVPKKFFSQIADMMSDAAVGGYNTATNKFENDDHPMENDFRKCLKSINNCVTLLDLAINASEDDDEDDISRYKNMIIMQEYAINMTCYNDYSSSYRSMGLTSKSKAHREGLISGYSKEIKEIEKKAEEKAEEEKQARIKAYWEAHADEKKALDAEKKELEDKKAKLNADIAEQDMLIDAAEAEKRATVPSEAETEEIKRQINELENRRSKLGLFARKEKNQIGEEIASLDGRVNALKCKIEEEKKAQNAEADQKASPAKAKKEELQSKLNPVIKRISTIDTILTKDPEEE